MSFRRNGILWLAQPKSAILLRELYSNSVRAAWQLRKNIFMMMVMVVNVKFKIFNQPKRKL